MMCKNKEEGAYFNFCCIQNTHREIIEEMEVILMASCKGNVGCDPPSKNVSGKSNIFIKLHLHDCTNTVSGKDLLRMIMALA